MHGRKVLTASAFLAAATLFAACGTGGSSGAGNPNPPGGNPGPSPTPNYTSDSVNMVNAVGALALSDQDLEMSQTSPKNGNGGGTPNGTCTYNPTTLAHAGYEFFQPDQKGTPNSTERIVFYDNKCTQMQMDVVRVVSNQTATSETVNRTISRYAQPAIGQATGSQIASRTETINYSGVKNGFDAYGYPNTNAPLIRTSTSTFNLTPPSGKSFTVTQDDEFIAGTPPSANTLAFCADDAGINQAGNYGFETQTDPSGGTITNNPDGSATFSMTRMGYSYPSGSLQLSLGTPNTVCPISTPYYTIAGGNTPGQYILPITIGIGAPIGYAIPPVVKMSVTNASFPNGETLNISTLTNGTTLPVQISGKLTNFAGTVGTFTLDAYGSGTLTVNSTGQTLPIQGWHVALN